MKIGTTPFIAENIVPSTIKSLAVFDGNEKICDVDITKMKPSDLGKKIYSFGLISDIHIYKKYATWITWNPEGKLDNALSFFESKGCDFCVHCGDITQTGFYDEDDINNLRPTQFAHFKEVCNNHTIQVYGICGNHESYVNPITNNLEELKTYTGNDLYYKVEYQNDVFIFCGQPSGTIPMSDEAFAFLSETLSANSNKRCFIFVHPVYNNDSGDADGVYANHSGLGGTLLSSWAKGTDLKNLLKRYPKSVLFHGHTHIKFEEQAKDKALNYTNKNGFHSVHIPSLGRPRDIIDNALFYADSESQGYIVDVYNDCIVLKGMDFISNEQVLLGFFKIDI